MYSDAGVRKKTLWGGQLEVSQRLGYENSNSTYFTPPYQATAKLSLSYTQPLLRRGRSDLQRERCRIGGNRRRHVRRQFAGVLQDHLLEVHRAYSESVPGTRGLPAKAKTLPGRRQGAFRPAGSAATGRLRTQVARAEAALAMRRANLVRAATSVRNAEAKVQLLVNDPALQSSERFEIVPLQSPCRECADVDVRQNVLKALHHRPDLDQAFKQIRAASVRADVAKNELLPVLNGVVSTYVSGLEGYETSSGPTATSTAMEDPPTRPALSSKCR